MAPAVLRSSSMCSAKAQRAASARSVRSGHSPRVAALPALATRKSMSREGAREAAVGGLRLVQLLGAELERAAVVRRQEVREHHGGLVAVEHLAQQEDVADALGHLLAVAADHPVVHPDLGERQAGGLALGDLVLVVREDEVAAAAVHVEPGAQVAQAHGRALDVPAGPAHAPRAVPGRLARLGGLPDGEVERVGLAGLGVDAHALLELVDALLAELAVLVEAAHAEVDAAVGRVGVVGADELADEVDDLGDRLRGLGLDVGARDAEPVGVLDVGGGVLLRHRLPGRGPRRSPCR